MDLARDFLKDMSPDFDLPSSLVVAIDNTPREGKNAIFAGWMAYLTSKMFSFCEVQFMQVSHTHNELDQRFSSMASVVKRAESLQSLEDLKSHLEQHMVPSAGRRMHVEIVHNTWNFKQWLALGTESEISGLVSTKKEGANHLWRFCRRDLLTDARPVECEHARWQNHPSDPDDVCVTFKQFMSDRDISQAPQLIMPTHVWQGFKKSELTPMHRNPLGPTTLAEFRKTAKFVGSNPWNLLEAQSFLEKFCDDNENDTVDAPPDLVWVFSQEADLGHRVQQIEPLTFEEVPLPEEAPPRKIRVKAKAKTTVVVKRPAAAVFSRPAAAAVPSLEATAADEVHGPASAKKIKRPAASTEVLAASSAAGLEEGPVAAASFEPPAANAEDIGEDHGSAQPSSPLLDSVEAIKGRPGFLYFGCSKCRKKQTAKIGCKMCRAKGDNRAEGFRRSTQGWVYRIGEDVE